MAVDTARVEALARELLDAIGEDPDRDGLADTPARFARWWSEFIDYQPGTLDTAFTVEQADEVVVVRGITVWSLCEHHLLPFRATVTVGYLPAGRVLGLSKLGRIAHAHAHRLQVQERMTADIADHVQKLADTADVAVIVHGEHLCMSMRGIRTTAQMRTSVMRGVFRDKPEARAEFTALADT